jgi:hypothetical protein
VTISLSINKKRGTKSTMREDKEGAEYIVETFARLLEPISKIYPVIPNLFRNLYFATKIDAEPLQKNGGQASAA